MNKLAIILISVATAFTGVAPAQALPRMEIGATAATENTNVVEVRHKRIYRHHSRHNGHRYDNRRYSRYDRHHYRNGYRRHHNNNAGAIIGGLAAGAIIGGIANSQPRAYYGGGNSHIRSCYARYRSYRASDNTYQPNYGPRRQCR